MGDEGLEDPSLGLQEAWGISPVLLEITIYIG